MGSTPVVSVVVMGVTGSGKTTVATELARRLGWDFTEGDDHHPPANVAKMAAGHPLDDTDRLPWLRELAAWIGTHEQSGRSCVLTCSALKRSYRDLLRDGHPSVWFAHVTAPENLITGRVLVHRCRFCAAPALSLVPEARPPPNGCWPTTAPVGLSLT